MIPLNDLRFESQPAEQPWSCRRKFRAGFGVRASARVGLRVAVCLLIGCGHDAKPASVAQEEIVIADSNANGTATASATSQASADHRSAEQAPVRSPSNSNSPNPVVSDDSQPDSVRGAPASSDYRMPKLRTAPNLELLKQHGLRKIESKRLVLITDAPDQELDQLPLLADQLFDVLQDWFGKLPPAADGSDYQVLGHVMIDRSRFRAAGLLPDESFTIRHGRSIGYSFWLEYPDTAYYRRHLALHEFVHCFMMCQHPDLQVPPPWYIEGMAELFGTHTVAEGFDGLQATFGVMPLRPEGFEGWGRIRAFRQPFADADHRLLPTLNAPTWNDVVPDRVAVFESPLQYASSWAVCWFLKHHPDARGVLPALAKQTTFVGFIPTWERQCNDLGNRLSMDWLLFAEQLDFGFDAERAFPVRSDKPAQSAREIKSDSMILRADRGWQDSAVRLQEGEAVKIECEGRCIMNETTQPWESTADGISVEYYRGHRLGQVVGVIVSEDGQRVTDRLPVGSAGTVTAPFAGRLWLQANDSSGSRSNNAGEFRVRWKRSP